LLQGCAARVIEDLGNPEKICKLAQLALVLVVEDADILSVSALVEVAERVTGAEGVAHTVAGELLLVGYHAYRVAPYAACHERSADEGAESGLLSAQDGHEYAGEERAAGGHVAEGVGRREGEA